MVLNMGEVIKCNSDIAILMATYNGENYIEDQINSILRQTNNNWELFIHDDGSKDKTVSIIKKYEENYPNKIHILSSSKVGGAKNNFFYLMNTISSNYIMFCDQDDYWIPDKIDKTFKSMIQQESKYSKNEPILIYSDLEVVDEHLNIISNKMSKYQRFDISKHTPEEFLSDNNVTGCTVMINTSLRNLACKATDYDQIIMHDWWLALLASKFGIIKFIPESLIMYRQHGDNSIGALKFGYQYISNRIKNRDDVRKRLVQTQKQASYCAGLFSLSHDDVIYQYGHISEHSKKYRVIFYIKNKIRKSGFVRNIGLLIYG